MTLQDAKCEILSRRPPRVSINMMLAEMAIVLAVAGLLFKLF